MKSITFVAILTAAMAAVPAIDNEGLAEAMSEPKRGQALEPRE